MAILTMTAASTLSFSRTSQEALNQLANKYTPPLRYDVVETNLGVASYYIELPGIINFENFTLEINIPAVVTLTLYTTLDPDLPATVETGWVDKTNTILGAATLSNVHDLYYCLNKFRCRYLLKLAVSNATNTIAIRLALS